jgi:K+ transporter
VCLKYAIFILLADNAGEGGIFALVGLLIGEKSRLGSKMKKVVVFTGREKREEE